MQVFYYYLLSICMCKLNKVREMSKMIFFFSPVGVWIDGTYSHLYCSFEPPPLSFPSEKTLIKKKIFFIYNLIYCMHVQCEWNLDGGDHVIRRKKPVYGLHMNFLFFLFYYQCKSYVQLAFYQNASLKFITFSQHGCIRALKT